MRLLMPKRQFVDYITHKDTIGNLISCSLSIEFLTKVSNFVFPDKKIVYLLRWCRHCRLQLPWTGAFDRRSINCGHSIRA